jgi:uncharacterized protein YjlB
MNVSTHLLKDDGLVPNNSRLPLVLYPQVVAAFGGTGGAAGGDAARAFERIFADNGWNPAWRDGIFPYHHYHSTQHEVLGIYAGWARVQFGGEQGPVEELRAGDAVVIPAGVGHKRLEGSSDLGVVGAYPPGADWDMNYARREERADALRNIEAVLPPARDPLFGDEGPLRDLWHL